MTRNRFRRNNRAIGKRAKSIGDQFEDVVRLSACRTVLTIERVPNGAQQVRGDLIRVKSPFDYAGAFVGGRAIFFDAKSCGQAEPSFRPYATKSGRNQIARLNRLAPTGAVCGFLVRSDRVGEYRWIDAVHCLDRKPIRWDDDRWIKLGPTTHLINFRPINNARTRVEEAA